MKIVAISDTHAKHKKVQVPECDVLIHAGDWSPVGQPHAIEQFFTWLAKQPAKHIVTVCGNHDFWPQESPMEFKRRVLDGGPDNIHYLQAGSLIFDAAVVIDDVKFWGSPWTPWFHDWAFNFPRKDPFLKTAVEHWELIHKDTDVLITHGPPLNILDKTEEGRYVGCPALRDAIKEIKPKIHIFGHIHEAYGGQVIDDTYYVNASQVNRRLQVTNEPVIIELD
jgi:predicted phosphodiesterase